MTKRLAILATLTALLAVPSFASAHTGSVSCTDQGIVFSYNNNFAHDTTVIENVNGTTKTFLVHAHTASTDTIPAPSASVIAGASWSDGGAGGSVPFVALACNYTQPPVSVCIPTETVTKTIYTPGPAVVQYVDVPGATTYVTKTKVVYRTRIKWKTRIKLVPYHEVTQPPNKRFTSKVPG